MNRRAVPLSSVVAVAVLSAAGCGQNGPPSASKAAPSPDGSAAVVNAKPAFPPRPELATLHPAPKDTPDLDRAETAAAEAPDDPKAQLALGHCYYKLKAYVRAAPVYEKAATLAPKEITPLLYLGYTRLALGELPKAVDAFQQGANLKGADFRRVSDAYLGIGDAFFAMGQDEKATEAFSKSIAYYHQQGLASLALGTYAAQNGRVVQARDFFGDAINDLPTPRLKARAYAAMGRLAAESKDPKQAAANYRKALALDPKNVWAARELPRLASNK